MFLNMEGKVLSFVSTTNIIHRHQQDVVANSLQS